jgi:hypothetical protein
MTYFSINQDAANKIKKRLEENICREPVVIFVDMAAADDFMLDIKKSIINKQKSNDEIANVAKERIKSIEKQLEYSITIIISEKATLDPRSLITVDEIEFSLNPNIQNHLDGYCLCFEDRRFLFKKGDSVIKNMQSLISGSKKGPSEPPPI